MDDKTRKLAIGGIVVAAVGTGLFLAWSGSRAVEHTRSSRTSTPSTPPPPSPYGSGTVSALISTAQSYVGAKEEPPDSNRGPIVDKFNEGTGRAWCAYYVSYVIRQIGVGTRSIPSVLSIYNRAKALGVLSTTPSPGAVFLQINDDNDRDGVDKGFNHTGIVTAVLPGGMMSTVEGNISNVVGTRQRAASDVDGYVPFSALSRVFS